LVDVIQEVATGMWSVLLITVWIFALAIFVRFQGWRDRTKLDPIWGVIIPNAAGIITLFLVSYTF
jgi:hypothetical protein